MSKQRIREKLNEGFLKQITQNLVNLYKHQDYSSLRNWHQKLHSHGAENLSHRECFFALLKLFHPDRAKWHAERYGQALKDGHQPLIDWYACFTSMDEAPTKKPDPSKDYSYQTEEEYAFDQEDFHQSWDRVDSAYQELWIREEEDEIDFVKALKERFLGNRPFTLTVEDISSLPGDLDLSSCDMESLAGVEHLVLVDRLNLADNRLERIHSMENLYHLKELNLSSNRLDDIDGLEPLENLEYLDLSHNEIDDPSILLKLPALRFVDLRNNPIENWDFLPTLQDRGVLVLKDL